MSGQERNTSAVSSAVFVEDVVELVPCELFRERSNFEGLKEFGSVLIRNFKFTLQNARERFKHTSIEFFDVLDFTILLEVRKTKGRDVGNNFRLVGGAEDLKYDIVSL